VLVGMTNLTAIFTGDCPLPERKVSNCETAIASCLESISLQHVSFC
jgi:hypothetical protein